MKDRLTFITLLSFLILISISIIQAQPDTLWTKTFGGTLPDCGYSVQQTTDGGYIITGFTESLGAGWQDIWLIKTDDSGDTLWTKTLGRTFSEYGYSVQQTIDGGYILAGQTQSSGIAGAEDIWLIKTNSSGDTLWTRTFGGSSYDNGYSVQQTTDGGYIITGCTIPSGAWDFDVFLIKTNESGDTIWTKSYGGDGNEESFSVQQTIDGGYIITGYTYSFSNAGGDVWLIKTDESGAVLWTKTFGEDFIGDGGYSVRQTTDGGYILTGYTGYDWPSNIGDIWLIKTDALGNTLWTKKYGRTGPDWGYSVQQTTDEGYIIVGTTDSLGCGLGDIWLIKTNSFGDTLWTRTFGGNVITRQICSIQQTTDDGYIIVGNRFNYGEDTGNIWLINTTPDVNAINYEDVPILDYSLRQNFPNPFNPSTTISWQIPEGDIVTLKIFSALGEEIATLVNEYKPAGKYETEFRAANLPSGVYFYQLKARDFSKTKKMLLLK